MTTAEALALLTRRARTGTHERSSSIVRDLRMVQIASDAIAAALGAERFPPDPCFCCDGQPPLDATHPEECPE